MSSENCLCLLQIKPLGNTGSRLSLHVGPILYESAANFTCSVCFIYSIFLYLPMMLPIYKKQRVNNGTICRIFSLIDDTGCQPNWYGFNDSCYFFDDENLVDFFGAKEACALKHAQVVSIHSEEEQIFLAGK